MLGEYDTTPSNHTNAELRKTVEDAVYGMRNWPAAMLPVGFRERHPELRSDTEIYLERAEKAEAEVMRLKEEIARRDGLVGD